MPTPNSESAPSIETDRAERSRRWRRVLLGGVAMGAAFVGYGRSVQAGPLNPNCSVSGSTVTCTGDLADGVSVGAPYTTLNVNSLTADITPGAGIIGLKLTGTSNNLTLNSDTGAFSITTFDAGADGIFVAATTSGVVDVHHSGDIQAINGAGIIARSDNGDTTVISSGRIDARYAAIYARTVTSGDVSVTHAGDVSSANNSGIRAVTFGLGDVTVNQTGDVTSANGRGIEADADSGDATVVSRGTIYARGAGIHANADSAASVTHTGDITSTNSEGIYSNSQYGPASIVSRGKITAASFGLYAIGHSGVVSITHTGDIITDAATGSAGIFAEGFGASVEIIGKGNIDARRQGIFAVAKTSGSVSVNQTGDITSANSKGIYAFAKDGAITIVSRGRISALSTDPLDQGDGIYAKAAMGPVSITHTGDVTSRAGNGIYAISGNYFLGVGNDVTIKSEGDIDAYGWGISGKTYSAGAVSITHTGDVYSGFLSGVYASTTDGDITIVTKGNLDAENAGILALSTNGAISITHTGDITSRDPLSNIGGIFAYSEYGSVKVVSTGTITSGYDGIAADGYGAVSVTHTGDITASAGFGILAYSEYGSVEVVSKGTIQAEFFGIYAQAYDDGSVNVTHSGDVTSNADAAIFAASYGGDVTVKTEGKLDGDRAGIVALTAYGDIDVTHSGDISSAHGEGIYAFSKYGNVKIASNGTIEAALDGIVADGYGDARVTHSGDITSTAGRGIYAYSENGNVTTVSVGGITARDRGINAYSYSASDVSVAHTGDITSTADMGIVAFSITGSVTIVTKGSITAEKRGIYAGSAGRVGISHTGDITSATEEAIRVSSSAGGVAVITLADGVVRGATRAIRVTNSAGTTLNLNAGSVIIGAIDLGAASVLNTGPGLSIHHTFDGAVPVVGSTSGNIYAVRGNEIAVADLSALDAADNQLSTMLDGVSGVLGGALARAAAVDGGSLATAYAKTASPKSARSFDAVVVGARPVSPNTWWITPFGGVGASFSTSSAPKTSRNFGGIVAGVDTALDNGMRLGAFGGFVAARLDPRVINGAASEATSYFGGVFGNYQASAYRFDFAVTAGRSSHAGSRVIANNTMPEGIETALSSYDSYFIAPELTITTAPAMFGGTPMTPSLRLRYEANFADGYSETGVDEPLSIGKATSHAINLRFQEAMPIALDDPAAKLVFRTGIDARFASQGGRDATLLGIAISGAGAGSETSLGGFGGLDLTYVLSDSASLKASTELGLGSAGIAATASLGIKIGF